MLSEEMKEKMENEHAQEEQSSSSPSHEEVAENGEEVKAETIFEEPSNTDHSDQSNLLEEANKKIAELEKNLKEMENKYLRLHADFDNFRRRSRLDFEASQKYRAQNLVEELIPAIDNFDRALKMEVKTEEGQSLLKGMQMIFNNIMSALEKEGVEPIDAVGKEFDPHFHQAVMQVSDENFESNTVVEELQKGYKLKDRVIRPSMVKVAE